MVHTIEKQWKEFSLNLETVLTAVKAIDANCCGISANDVCQLHFTEEPSAENKTAIDNYWDALTSGSTEATGYKSRSQIVAAVEAAKTDALTKTWDTLSVAQKKLAMGMNPTNEELFV